MRRINLRISNELRNKEQFWAGFLSSLERFKYLAGKKLQQGDADVMTVYRTGLVMYDEGLKDIDNLKALLESKYDTIYENKIINIANQNQNRATLYENKKLG